MIKLLILLLVTVVAVSCSENQHEELFKSKARVCSVTQLNEAKQFVTNSLMNMNNVAVEDMDEVIYQLEKTSIRMTCPERVITYRRELVNGNYEDFPVGIPDTLFVQ